MRKLKRKRERERAGVVVSVQDKIYSKQRSHGIRSRIYTICKKVNDWRKYQPIKHNLNKNKIQKPNKETVHITNRRNGLNAKT